MFLCVAILYLFRFNCLFLSRHHTAYALLSLIDNNHLVRVEKTSWFGLKYLIFLLLQSQIKTVRLPVKWSPQKPGKCLRLLKKNHTQLSL